MMTATAPRAWAAARFAVASTTAGEGRMTARARANPGEGSRPAGGRVARWGARVGNARWVNGGVGGGFSVGGAVNGNKVVAAVAVNGKASRPSIDEMDMDPEHVKFASQDELDNSAAMACKDGVCSYVIDDITAPVQSDMEQMRSNILDIVGRKNPLLLAAADQIFGAGGKRLRPVLVFLVARATAQLMDMDDITERQRRLAEITEMIHTASLVHDDVLDDCDTRRGAETIHTLYGTRVAILAGDFLFAQSSWYLANLDNLEVIKLISQVIADFADGEISQAGALFNCDVTLEGYLEKSHNKTASLIAASCKSAAVFSEVSEDVKMDMYEYGKHLGLAFQIVDDILDFTQSEAQLGKPKGQDLASGNLTAPCIFALGRDPRLRELIETRFAKPEDLAEAIEIVNESGIEDARRMAREEADQALAALKGLPEGEAKTSLVDMVGYVLERLY
mmetsp:Transcript_8116/g.36941  ORF Transcript_8116/g.36941 Transcript_8116/m.36941 type:complete len:450 (+) Transcript_8116:111-1460(+)